jgi:hypothetical protein
VNSINIFPLDPSTPIYQTSQTIFGGQKSLSHYTACFKFWVYFIPFLLLLFYFLFLFPPLLRIYEVYIHTSFKIKLISNDRVSNNSLQFFIVLLPQGYLNNISTCYCVVLYSVMCYTVPIGKRSVYGPLTFTITLS